jgi:pimeloyl-ACP methyl ester carboxylesterase
LVGHDWGGVAAHSLAANHPDSVAALAVLDVTIPGSDATDFSQGGRRWHHGLHRTPDLPEALITGREDVYLKWFFENFGHRADVIDTDEQKEYVRTYSDPDALRAGFELYRATPKNIAATQALAARGPLRMPVLAMGGDGGWGRGPEVADSLRPLADDVQGVVIEHAGHWLAEEQPVLVAEHLLEFFARVPTRGIDEPV